MSNPTVDVEVVLRRMSNIDPSKLEAMLDSWLRKEKYVNNGVALKEVAEEKDLSEHVDYVVVCDDSRLNTFLPSVSIQFRPYKLVTAGPETEEICVEGEEQVPASQHWMMPNQEFQGLWETLVYDTQIKSELVRFVETSLLLSDRGVDTNIVTCNRVVLLHGPPGTGKTSLCKALAQKLAIRMNGRYKATHLVEINSHSLFSKWFSESGKLVQKMFEEIRLLMEDPNHLVCVLIDEVESLTAARTNSMSGSEPSDAIRVVNALLTQLDSIKNSPNVLILTTSNITGAIDLAFVDRADIKQYVGHPSQAAIYQILHSCLAELGRRDLVVDTTQCLGLRELQLHGMKETADTRPSLQLWEVAARCAKASLSGRSVRKIPFLALALFSPATASEVRPLSLAECVLCLSQAADRQLRDREQLSAVEA